MKEKSYFVCSNCGYESIKWFGKCPQCGEWNTATEFNVGLSSKTSPTVLTLNEALKTTKFDRLSTGFTELDAALGGGVLPGQVILLGGEPGVGKSTLALEICESFSRNKLKTLYVAAEESADQIALRAQRLLCQGLDQIMICSNNELEHVLEILNDNYSLLVVDSLQTMYSPEVGTYPGSIVQIRTCAEKIIERCKQLSVPSILIAHITKSGEISGPKLVEHLVDTVVYFEGERNTELRILRTMKNRFGPSGEIAVFEMAENGLKQVINPAFYETQDQLPGNCLACAVEGSRTFVVQVQALVSRTKSTLPRRVSNGFDMTRLLLLIAVIGRHMQLPIESHDIYVNILGGLKITDPGIDAAVVGALLSSMLDKRLGKTALIGEVSLDGSLRRVHRMKSRIEALRKIGIEKIIAPKVGEFKEENIQVIDSVKELGRIFEVK
ncbi:DNA repair protein RadA [Pseudothermotoga sp. U03pept]|uniref:DNA repair protein RadA n=1 Tax=Pseudothermotoga sp. U03pept TaxID=3447012 RepID=UPI003EFC4E5F